MNTVDSLREMKRTSDWVRGAQCVCDVADLPQLVYRMGRDADKAADAVEKLLDLSEDVAEYLDVLGRPNGNSYASKLRAMVADMRGVQEQ